VIVVRLARIGYACKAFIYAVVGVLAATAAFRLGGRITDTRGALRVILTHPFGNSVLYVLGAGLCGYAAWRILDAAFDPDRRGTSAKGLVIRIGGLFRALFYGALGIEALRLASGLRASTASDARIRSWTARALDLPLGEWLVGITGLITAVYGLSEVVESIKKEGAVNSSAGLARGFGRLGSTFQSGQVGTYAWTIVVGVLLVLGLFTFRG